MCLFELRNCGIIILRTPVTEYGYFHLITIFLKHIRKLLLREIKLYEVFIPLVTFCFHNKLQLGMFFFKS